MDLRKLLVSRGIHYLITRFGPSRMRSLAFDEKYRRGDWNFHGDSEGELPLTVKRFLNGGSLLMMACGNAAILENFDPTEYSAVLGIDLSEEAVRRASRYSSEKVRFRVADMVTFECPASYNVILFSESIYYVPLTVAKGLLGRLAANLNPGGVFVVTLAEPERYRAVVEMIRMTFKPIEDRSFAGSKRRLLVFS